jgi:hypothetical protein
MIVWHAVGWCLRCVCADIQSWPIEVPGFPALTWLGAYANYSHVYTPADIANIVAYAKDRGIRVVPGARMAVAYSRLLAACVSPSTNLAPLPTRRRCMHTEIDTPAHSDILKYIYPELMTVINCDGHDCPLNHTFRTMPDPTNPATWEFLEAMITQVWDGKEYNSARGGGYLPPQCV